MSALLSFPPTVFVVVDVLIRLHSSRFPGVFIQVTSCLWEAVYLVELFVF